jgi:copper chaperone
MVEKATLHIEGMTCTGCEQRIGKALGRIEGVSTAAADYRTGVVAVRFDPKAIDRVRIERKIQEMGYCVIADDGAHTP